MKRRSVLRTTLLVSTVAATVTGLSPRGVQAGSNDHHSHSQSSSGTDRRSVHNSDAARASEHRRHHARYDRTLDPLLEHGQPITVPLTSTPVAFGRAPAQMQPVPQTDTNSNVSPIVDDPAIPRAEADPRTRLYDHVVIVSIDGLRPDAIDMSDSPNLRMLREQGAIATEARTITHSYTLPSHTSMLTGVDTDRHGLLHNSFNPAKGFTRAPSALYYAHDEGFTTAMFVSKPKLRHIAIPGSVDVFTRPDYVCGPVVRAAGEHIANTQRGITFVHLSEPDEYGHSRGWMTRKYLEGIGQSDRCVGTLLTAIGRRTDLDRVLIIITADHGGHGRTHGSERDVDMRIPWIAWGGSVRRGAWSFPVNTMDTAATALAALGVAVPDGMVGRPVPIALGMDPPANVVAPQHVEPTDTSDREGETSP